MLKLLKETHFIFLEQVCRLSFLWAEMYAGQVACCPLMSHGEYADETDRRTDAIDTVQSFVSDSVTGQRGAALYRGRRFGLNTPKIHEAVHTPCTNGKSFES